MSTTTRHPAITRGCAALGLAVLALGAAACGDGESSEGGADTQPGTEVPGSTETVETPSPSTTPPSTAPPSTALPSTTLPSTSLLPPPSASTVPSGQTMVDTAIADMASRRGLDVAEITFVSSEDVTWRDGSIGCPRKDMSYTMALVPGMRIVLESGEFRDVYHSGNGGTPFYCAVPKEPLESAETRGGGSAGDV